VIKSYTCSYTRTLRFLIFRSCTYLDSLGKMAFGPKLGFRNKFRTRVKFGLVIAGSGRVRGSNLGSFTTLLWCLRPKLHFCAACCSDSQMEL